MSTFSRMAVAASLVTGLIGCAALDDKLDDKKWYQDARSASTKAVGVAADSTAKALKLTQHYLAEKDVLKTFKDASEHSEAAVLEVLHKSGIAHGKASAAGGTGKAAGGSASRGAQAKGHAAPPTSIPIDYAGALRWPVDGGVVSSEYGPRWGKVHKGMDIAADKGDPVYAIAAGEVIYAGDGLRGYGNLVILRHDKLMTSLYAHNSELKVHQGDHITQGTLLALLGSTGHSTGPHVHFEIRQGDNAVDPRGVLPKFAFAGDPGPARTQGRLINASAH